MAKLCFVVLFFFRFAIILRFANGYCSRVGGKVRGWVLALISWMSFANPRCYTFDICDPRCYTFDICDLMV